VSGPSRLLPLVLACVLLAGAGCGGGDDKPAAPAATATATPEDTGGEQGTGCKPADKPAPKRVKLPKPKVKLDRTKTYVATVKTNCGSFQITLDARRAPRTGGSFKYLADQRFFDGLTFHRIVADFVIQGGDPAGTGAGGPGYSVVEAPPQNLKYTKGVVAMAKTELEDPGTSGSQFFVVTAATTPLEPLYALVGRVTKGQDVVDRIGVAPVGADDQPVEPIVIDSIRVAVS
jgi:peptidyl-prolyl cis-trans isomerase B (cyclophilin B)